MGKLLLLMQSFSHEYESGLKWAILKKCYFYEDLPKEVAHLRPCSPEEHEVHLFLFFFFFNFSISLVGPSLCAFYEIPRSDMLLHKPQEVTLRSHSHIIVVYFYVIPHVTPGDLFLHCRCREFHIWTSYL